MLSSGVSAPKLSNVLSQILYAYLFNLQLLVGKSNFDKTNFQNFRHRKVAIISQQIFTEVIGRLNAHVACKYSYLTGLKLLNIANGKCRNTGPAAELSPEWGVGEWGLRVDPQTPKKCLVAYINFLVLYSIRLLNFPLETFQELVNRYKFQLSSGG